MWFIVDQNIIIRCIPVLAEITKAIEDLSASPDLSHAIKNSLNGSIPALTQACHN